MKAKKTMFVGIIGLVLVGYCSAADTPLSPAEARREQMRQQMAATYQYIDQALTALFEKINFNQRPEPMHVQLVATLLEENRRSMVAYNDEQKAGFMLLQAWVAYFQDDASQTMNWATRACREDPTNGDAWISQSLFSMIHGRRPLDPEALRPQPSRRARGQGRGGDAMMQDPSMMHSHISGFGRPGTLKFDLETLNLPFLRQRFGKQEYKTTDGSTITYTPDENILCLLFWKGKESVAVMPQIGTAPDDPAATMHPVPDMTSAHNVSSLQEQQGFFEVFRDLLAEREDVLFAEINTNSAAAVDKAIEDHYAVAPLIAAARDNSGAEPFLRLDVEQPFMVIVDNDGQVKYAGPAEGFMPAFVLTHLTGVAIDLEPYLVETQPTMDPFVPHAPGMDGAAPYDMMPSDTPPSDDSSQGEKQYRELTPEQEMEAERKITYIRDLFIRGSRLRVQSYKRGVDFCREVMRDFPDTKYAEEAQHLLRQVPEHRRSTYNITDEELGF